VPSPRRLVRDDPERPDPRFAELYASLPDAAELEPWLSWCRRAAPPVLYLGVGAGRLAAPLAAAGVRLVGVDSHPGMLAALRARSAGIELVQARIEELDLGRRFDLVICPSGVLGTPARLAAAARHSRRWVGLELTNPHWLAAGAGRGVRVLALSTASAEIEVDYPGGWTQVASVPLMWPEQVERFLEGASLQLVLMRGGVEQVELAASPTYYVLASIAFPSAEIPSTY
jgi:hypothetical protein